MDRPKLRIQYLLLQFAENRSTEAELLELLNLIKRAKHDSELAAAIDGLFSRDLGTTVLPNINKEQIYTNILAKDPRSTKRVLRKVWLWPLAAACIVLAILAIFNKRGDKPVTDLQLQQNAKRLPAKIENDRAVLTLSNGTTVILDSAENGVISEEPFATVSQIAKGQLLYEHFTKGQSKNKTFYNMVSTQHGKKYQVTLVDGTKVWLNAMSSIKFPVDFSGTERVVELHGEAYFEVAKLRQKPFIVRINGSEVKVLGTHFNVMGYKEEGSVNTTLFEGSVQVKKRGKSKIIIPGEQAKVLDNILVVKADTAKIIAWKNGQFNFANENIRSIMRKISRWYNVDVDYRGKVTEDNLTGMIPQSKDLKEVLSTLELTKQVHFKVQEGRVIVMP